MRKLMNKKGFSLVELMIVVVIMGILIAVAIPLYGAITKNANNKTCASNVKTIKNNAANYYASYDQQTADKTALLSMMEGGAAPKCPIDKTKDYSVKIAADGSATVCCPNYDTTKGHTPEGAVTANTLADSISLGA